ncbi:MAG: prolipoprotein diacylglyceryl transferase [Xanthomonadales bacterium]|nr:prolipoprotein diacylglyceryl transferase [Xanthomonadales bacterium]
MSPEQLHLLFELLAYALGFQLFLRQRRRYPSTATLAQPAQLALLAGAILGAALGSRLSWWLQDPQLAFAGFPDAMSLMRGKSILGGLLGGVAGVELAKARIGLRASTGDAFVWPILLALALGRIGCHLAGVSDHTAGLPTNAPFAFDYGDGVPRHPTALYEIAFLVAWGSVIALLASRLRERGDRFRLLMFGYCALRLYVESLKPTPLLYPPGLSGLQWLAVAGLLYYSRSIPRIARQLSEARP